MRLKNLFIRFYRSFNFDYLRKHSEFHESINRKTWEILTLEEEEKWYPYVQIPIDPKVTTVVGANESGKSHLLDAIEKGIEVKKIERKDFCRYSEFFTVQEGKMRYPDFGYEWFISENDDDKKNIKEIKQIFSIPGEKEFRSFFIFRVNKDEITLYLPGKNNQYEPYKIKYDNSTRLSELLPEPIRIDSEIAIPDSVPIIRLIERAEKINALLEPQINNIFAKLERKDRILLTEEIDKFVDTRKKEEGSGDREQSSDVLKQIWNRLKEDKISPKRVKEVDLAYKLICTISKISVDALIELAKEMLGSEEGHTRAIIEQINKGLAENLNFPSWWVQDRDFQLVVSARDYDLGFAIRDRTGTEYSFSERSSGLRYFLSYYIQYKAHEPNPKVSQILLMDEPDQYLSSQAQQNLLKIFKFFSEPDDGKKPVQVIYVTHSPFLIDKNHPERIRVVEKGVDDEGTRVVNDASKNHYEPLRSAFGELVGESAFIGNCNLIVESIADKILIAGASTYLSSLKDISSYETLDLNQFTVISAEGSDNIYDLLYLMRGKDIQRPAVIVLMNSTKESNEVIKDLDRIENHLLDTKFILQIEKIKDEVFLAGPNLVEIEDLIPVSLCVEGAKKYLRDFCKFKESETQGITEKAIKEQISQGKTIFQAVKSCVSITRIGFARSIVDIIQEWQKEGYMDLAKDAKDDLVHNFKTLFSKLNDMKQEAIESFNLTSVKQRVKRHIDGFIKDHQITARRSDVKMLLKNIENTLDNSEESNKIKLFINEIGSDLSLEKDLKKPVADYEDLIERLRAIQHRGRITTQDTPVLPKDDDFKDENELDTSSESPDSLLEITKEEDEQEQTSEEKSQKPTKNPRNEK